MTEATVMRVVPDSAVRVLPKTPPSPVTDYTHREWLYQMAILCGHLAGIRADLSRIDDDLDAVKAGRTHRRLVAECAETFDKLLEFGVSIIKATDNRYMPVYERIMQAGGLDEVAQAKIYHDRT